MSTNQILAEHVENYITHDDAIHGRLEDPYADSPFKIYREMSSKTKGKYFEAFVEEYCENLGWKVERAKNTTEYDRVVNNYKVEVKGSTVWAGKKPHFRWQQIRPEHCYDIMVFVAVYPDRMEFYSCTKEEIVDYVTNQNWLNQHGGKTKNSGTFFIDGFPEDFPFFKTLFTHLEGFKGTRNEE